MAVEAIRYTRMKKLLRKFRSQAKPPETGGRITNETVAEHRERVLAGGRKFKYPLQYTKHRVLVISTVLSVLAVVLFVVFFAWSLYFGQAYDRFTYGLTRVFPVPVAKVDADFVRYSDYLSELRSSVHYLTTKEAVNFNSVDGKRQLDYLKRRALDKSMLDAYVAALASKHNIRIEDKEVDDFVQRQIVANKLGVSESVYKQVISDYYDWTFDEYKRSVRKELLAKKVNAALDGQSKSRIVEYKNYINGGGDFASVAATQSEDEATKAQGGDVGFVSKSSDDPNGLIQIASAMQPNQVSDIIEGADGFYLIKLLEKRDNGDVRFAKIFIAYKAVASQYQALQESGKITEFIKVEKLANPINQ